MFRIYDLQNGDLRHFAEIIHIRKLSLDSMEDIGHVEVLSRFTNLTELYMRLPKRRDFSFVNKLSSGLTKFSLCVDFSQEVLPLEMPLMKRLMDCILWNGC